jgi:hypothetical protein
MLIPIRSRQLLIGLVTQRSANAEDYVANKVKTLLEELQEITDDDNAIHKGMVAVFLICVFMSILGQN